MRIPVIASLWFAVVVGTLIGCGSNTTLLNAPSTEAVQTTTAFPAVVEVILPEGVGLCTGTFISPRAVITASHCALNEGSYTVATASNIYTTSEKVNFGPGVLNDPNDIAVLIFDQDVADPSQGQVMPLGTMPQAGQGITLVGFGCNDLNTQDGAGVKRTGTNQLYAISDYLILETTPTAEIVATHSDAQRILGPLNQAGSCFGDSGGPMFQTQGNTMKLVGATHAGGWDGNLIESEYINLERGDNLAFLHRIDQTYSLNLFTGCWNSDDPEACGGTSANFGLFAFFHRVWAALLSFF